MDYSAMTSAIDFTQLLGFLIGASLVLMTTYVSIKGLNIVLKYLRPDYYQDNNYYDSEGNKVTEEQWEIDNDYR